MRHKLAAVRPLRMIAIAVALAIPVRAAGPSIKSAATAAINVRQPESRPPRRPPMTLAELEGMALGNHPGLGRAAAQLRAAQGNWLQVGLPPNPVVGYSGNQMGDFGTAGQQGGYIEQEFITGGKLRLQRAAAAAAVRAKDQQLRAMQMRVVNDVRLTFFDVLVAQQSRDLALRLREVADEGTRTADALLKAEEGNRINLLQAQIEAQNARITATNAENRYLAAWRKLAAVVGMPYLAPQPLAGSLQGAIPRLDFNAMVDRLYAESPERATALAEVLRARWTLQRELAEPTPNVDVQTLIQQNQVTDEANISVQAILPLPLWNRNQGGVRRAQAEVAAAQTNVARVELDLQQRLAVAFERYSNASQQVERYEQSILPAANESLQLVTVGWQQGEFDYITRLTSQRTFFQANLDYLTSLGELRASVVEIEGLLLTESLKE